MKFSDLFYYKIMLLMFAAKLNSLPRAVQKFFSIRETQYDLRGVCKFSVQKARKGIKRRRVSVVGVKLWNDVYINIKTCNSC